MNSARFTRQKQGSHTASSEARRRLDSVAQNLLDVTIEATTAWSTPGGWLQDTVGREDTGQSKNSKDSSKVLSVIVGSS